jgi:hypothetical protein
LRTAKSDLTPKVVTWRNSIEGLQRKLESAGPMVTSLKTELRSQTDDLGTMRGLAGETIEGIIGSVRKLAIVLEKLTFIPKNFELGEVYTDSWELIVESFRLEFNKLAVAVSQGGPSEALSAVLRALTIKESLMTQVIKGLLHKKVLLWNDLDIREGEYAKTELVEASKFIMDYSEEHGYFPTRTNYSHPVKSINALPSLYDRAQPAGETDPVLIIDTFSEAFAAMQKMIENNFRLSVVSLT